MFQKYIEHVLRHTYVVYNQLSLYKINSLKINNEEKDKWREKAFYINSLCLRLKLPSKGREMNTRDGGSMSMTSQPLLVIVSKTCTVCKALDETIKMSLIPLPVFSPMCYAYSNISITFVVSMQHYLFCMCYFNNYTNIVTNYMLNNYH